MIRVKYRKSLLQYNKRRYIIKTKREEGYKWMFFLKRPMAMTESSKILKMKNRWTKKKLKVGKI